MIPGKSPQCRHFTRQNALFEKTLVLLLSRFLVDRFPVIKEMIDLTISKLYISNVPRISPSEMFDKLIILQKCHFTCQTACYFCYFCVFLLCFIKLILGNRYGPGVSSCQQTLNNNLGGRIFTLHLNYVAGYTGPLLFLFERTHNYPGLLTTRGFCPGVSVIWAGPKFVRPHWWESK